VKRKKYRIVANNFKIEQVAIADLKPHAKNYRGHPEDQLTHLQQSLKQFGFYRNVVIAKDGTILAGHGVVQAAKKNDTKTIPVIRLDVAADDPLALKVLIGDNEIEHLAEQDDRMLSELLKQINDSDVDDLLGTGFDRMMLANLVMISRPESEIKDFDEAAEWVGMPEFESQRRPPFVIVNFKNEKDRLAFCKKIGFSFKKTTKSIWYPERKNEDIKSVKFEQSEK